MTPWFVWNGSVPSGVEPPPTIAEVKMPRLTLYITSKNYSSWSMRPWLVMRHFGIVFEERMMPLDAQGKVPGIMRISGTGKVPCLIAQEPDGDLTLWE